jgi:hypothetical protein
MSVFDKYYAQFYDMLYKDKDYESESNYIISLIKNTIQRQKAYLTLDVGQEDMRSYFLIKVLLY